MSRRGAAYQAEAASRLSIGNREQQTDIRLRQMGGVGARTTFTEKAKKHGINLGTSESEAQEADLRYPTGRPSATTILKEGEWRYALTLIYTFFGAVILYFFTAYGKVWVVENIVADGVLAKSLAHGIFAGFGMYICQSFVQHIVSTVDPSLTFMTSFMPHRRVEFGATDEGAGMVSNMSIISAALCAVIALGGSLVAAGLVYAFQFNTATLAGTPIGLVEHDRPFWSEFIGSTILTWAYFVGYYEPGFAFHYGNPASLMGIAYGVLILFTAPYTGGALSWGSHFGPAIVSMSITTTTSVDWLYYYISTAAGQLFAILLWYFVFRSTRMENLAPTSFRKMEPEA